LYIEYWFRVLALRLAGRLAELDLTQCHSVTVVGCDLWSEH